jgi:hypothetical protein
MSLLSVPSLTPATWQYRTPITVYSASTTTADVEVAIPDDWDLFWSNVRTSGEDIRVTTSNGTTLSTFGLSSFNKTNRTGTIQIDAASLQTGANCFWLYWGHASAATAATSPTISAPVAGYIELSTPAGPRVLRAGQQQPRTTSSTLAPISKAKADKVYVYVVPDDLNERADPHGQVTVLDELGYVTYEYLRDGTTAEASMVDATATRFVSQGTATEQPSAVMVLFQGSHVNSTEGILSITYTTARGARRNVRGYCLVTDYGI